MAILGYARVSTSGQVLDIQELQLRAAGCTKLYADKLSGLDDGRPQLTRLLRDVRDGDLVIFAALDRLTRGGPYKTLRVLAQITSRGATYKSLAEPWLDTTTELGEVMAALVGYVARKNRDDIVRRTSAGRDQARARGVKFGRKPKMSDAQKQEAITRREAGEGLKAIAQSYGVHFTTIFRLKGKT